jgi:hypothetical protein
MNEELKRKWIEALRAGEYRQYRGALHDGRHKQFCCLGVLWDLNGRPDDIDYFWKINLDPEKKETCIHLNDDEHKSFSEIADYIEQNL